MTTHADHEGDRGDEEENDSWSQKKLEQGGVAHAASEFRTVHEMTEGFKTARGGAMALQATEAAELEEGLHGAGVSNYLAPVALASGVNNLINGKGPDDKIAGGLETVSGGIGTAGLAGSALTSAGATSVGGALTGAAAAAAPVAAIAGAGAAGMAAGRYGNEVARRHGWAGKNDDGSNRNWSEMAADWGGSAEEAVGHGWLGKTAGLAATGFGSVVGAAGAAGSAAYGAGEGIYDAIANSSGGLPSEVAKEKKDQDFRDHRDNVDWFAKNGEGMRKTNPYVYEMMNRNYGKEAKEHSAAQGELAKVTKGHPELYELLSHWTK